MRILNLSNVAGKKRGGGVHEVVFNFWKLQNLSGLDSYLWFPGSKEEEKELYSESKLPKVRALATYFGADYGILKNRIVLQEEICQYEIIHQHGVWLPISFLTTKFSKQRNKISIIQPHGYLEPYRISMSMLKKKISYYLFEKKNIENSNMLVACSYDEYLNLKSFFPNKDIAIIPNGIPSEFFRLKASENYFDHKKYKNRKNLLFLSRIHPLKGLKRLLNVFGKLDGNLINDWNLVIAGIDENNHVNELKKLVLSLNLDEKVFFEGPKYGQEKINIMSSCDLFILPTYNENYGIVVAESLSRGTPVLTTKGAPWKILEDKGCGFWAENDEIGLRESLIVALSKSKSQLDEMGEIGKDLAEKHFLWDSIIKRTQTMYEWLLNGGEKPNFIYLGDKSKTSKNIFK